MTIAIITEDGVRKVAPLALLAQQAAASAQIAAQAATAAAAGRIYASYSAGNAATTTGQYFFVASGGALDLYVHGTATAVVKLPTIDVSTGEFGLGTSTPEKLAVFSDGGGNGFEIEPREGDFTRLLSYNRVTNGYTPMYVEGDSVRVITSGGTWVFNSAGHFFPLTDNAEDAGGAANRIKTIHLVNSPSVTSDEREKDWRGAPNEAELRAAKRIVAELGFYQWKTEPDGPLRFGAKAQAVRDILADEGLLDGNPARYGLIDHHEWTDGETEEPRDRYSICTDQLALFLLTAQEVRLLALEAAL